MDIIQIDSTNITINTTKDCFKDYGENVDTLVIYVSSNEEKVVEDKKKENEAKEKKKDEQRIKVEKEKMIEEEN